MANLRVKRAESKKGARMIGSDLACLEKFGKCRAIVLANLMLKSQLAVQVCAQCEPRLLMLCGGRRWLCVVEQGERFVPVPQPLGDVEPQIKRFGSVSAACKLPEFGIGMVIKSGFEVILGNCKARTFAVGFAEGLALEQVLVHPYGAVGLAPAAKQLPEGKVQFDAIRLLSNEFGKGVDGPLGLFLEDKIESAKIGLGQVLGAALGLTRLFALFAGCQPAEDEKEGCPR